MMSDMEIKQGFGVRYRGLPVLNLYLFGTLFFSFLFLFTNSFGGDLNYWAEWCDHLGEKGFANFQGNYPPVYILWLWGVAKVVLAFGQPLEPNILLKLLCVIPPVAAHMVLVRIIHTALVRLGSSGAKFHLVMAFAAFNPAFFLDGPSWSQVDAFPLVFVVAALYLFMFRLHMWAVLPLYTLSLLTKFQMICFAPIFGIIFLRDFRTTVIGCGVSLVIIGVVLLPSIVTGNAALTIKMAYIDTLGQFPVATLNAGNIWMLLADNNWPDTRAILGLTDLGFLSKLLSIKVIGFLVFGITSFAVFIYGLFRSIRQQALGTEIVPDSIYCLLALLQAITFFAFLPAMHERYLMPAVGLSLFYLAFNIRSLPIAILVTLSCTFNILVIHGLSGSKIWPAISFMTLAAFWICVMDIYRPAINTAAANGLVRAANLFKLAPEAVLIILVVLLTPLLASRTLLREPELAANQVLLNAEAVVSSRQDHDRLIFNKSTGGNPLTLNNRRYKYGFGTHANSEIVLSLPEKAVEFTVTAGLDQETDAGNVVFRILAGDEVLWESRSIVSGEPAVSAKVDVKGKRRITLQVDGNGGISYDHADWVDPVVTLAE